MIAVIMEMKDLTHFKSIKPYTFGKRVLGYYIPCPFDITGIADLDYLLGRQIMIDGEAFSVNTVEVEGEGALEKGGQLAVWVTKIAQQS